MSASLSQPQQEDILSKINASRRDLLSPQQREIAEMQHECRVENQSEHACTKMCVECRGKFMGIMEKYDVFAPKQDAA